MTYSDCGKSDNAFFKIYLSAWSAKFGEVPETLPTKQLFWDRLGVLEDKALMEWPYTRPFGRARSRAVLGCYGDLPSAREAGAAAEVAATRKEEKYAELESTAITFLSRFQLRCMVFSTPQPTAC